MAEIETWNYTTLKGERFTVKRRIGKGEKPWREPKDVTGPYLPLDYENLPPDGTVVIVEGERCRDAVHSKTPFAATTWPGGAQSVRNTDWTVLAGRDVILWPDRDEPGFKAMEKLAQHLFDLGCNVARVDVPPGPPDRPEDGWDAADATPDEAARLIENAVGYLPPEYPAVCDDWQAPGQRTKFLVEGWLPAGRVSLFSGQGGLGKSKLAIMLATAVASGDDWMAGGPKVQQKGPVVFASWEDSRDDFRYRLCDWPKVAEGDARERLPALLEDQLTFLDCAKSGPAWGPKPGRHTSTTGELLKAGQYIRSECERRSAKLLVMDPLAAAFACNENDRGLVRRFMSDWDGWARTTGCAVLLVAHPPKSGADYSGSTDWHSAARAVWTMELAELPPDKEHSATQLACVKSNYGRKPAPLQLHDWKWWRATTWPAETEKSARKAGKKKLTKEDIL